MASLRTTPVLADAADLLGAQLLDHVVRLSHALQTRGRLLERKFAGWLRARGFEARERRALAAVTVGAAAKMLQDSGSLPAFFEQVEYNGRRLAKLDLPPGSVLGALREYGRLAAEALADDLNEERANLHWAAEQLNFCIVLTLNNAFYQVREAETKAFFDLSQSELESGTQRELLERSLVTMARFCRAEAACLALVDRSRDTELLIGGSAPAPSGAALRRLARPRQFHCAAAAAGGLLLDATWKRRYEFVWSIPLAAAGTAAGAMQFAFAKTYDWLPRELRLLKLAAERCLMASEKLRLAEDLAAREEQIRQLARHMVEVEEAERRRISRELHDEAGQTLLYLRLQLDIVERSARSPEPGLVSALAEARSLIDRTVLEMRRLISDLSPAALEQLGLCAAVRQLAKRFQRLYGIPVRLNIGRLERLPGQTETTAYRLVQECCNNIARHAAASSVNLSLVSADGYLRLRIEDDGVGFRMEDALAKNNSFGLAGMRERVTLAGGRFSIDTRPGRGTAVAIELPIAESRNYAENSNLVGR